MAIKTLTVEVDPSTGNTTIETSGFTGGECAEMTADLEKGLGTVTKDVKKAEFHAKPLTVSAVQKARG